MHDVIILVILHSLCKVHKKYYEKGYKSGINKF